MQYQQPKSEKNWDINKMYRRFETAIEARKLIDDLGDQLKQVNYNKDLYKLVANCNKLVNALSSAEVNARQQHKPNIVNKPREELANAIDYAEKMLIIAKLSM